MTTPLEPQEYSQYGRQMIVPQIGLEGQLRLKNAAVLVVGAGGLGSPALAYLGGAGIGLIGIVDGDTVEQSNLHRQIIHSRARLGMPKCKSAAAYLRDLNPNVETRVYETLLTAQNAIGIAKEYDVILDCTDSPMSRYLVNDTAVVLGKPLVSASALKTEGQLAVYHYQNGPCYRCVFPIPPPASSVGACSDAGIIGPVVGLMGVMQAIEAIKIIACPDIEFTPSLIIFGALSFPPFRCMKIRGRQAKCAVCGDNPTINQSNLKQQDYADFCGIAEYHKLAPHQRLKHTQVGDDQTILDIRPAVQFNITSVPGSINVPFVELKRGADVPDGPLVVVCRMGNDSQEAVKILTERGIQAKDVQGGLSSWGPAIGLPEY